VQLSFFITFEGIEGSGKTTQIRRLAESLRKQGAEVLATREPGGCPVADAIRNILLHPANTALVPRAELLLYAAARAQHVEEVILPALRAGKVVLCDRYTDATLAYQGNGRGLETSLITELNTLASEGLSPDLTLLLDMPAEEGLSRARRRNAALQEEEEDRFEREAIDFHRRVREGYLHLARMEAARFQVIDARGTEEAVAERILTAVEAFVLRQRERI
jgi:dTMP kinase